MTTLTAIPDFEKLVKATVLSMPAAKHLGFDFGRVAPGEVEIVQPYREELTEHNGFFQADRDVVRQSGLPCRQAVALRAPSRWRGSCGGDDRRVDKRVLRVPHRWIQLGGRAFAGPR